MSFDFWHRPGEEKYGGLRDGYYTGVQCAIIMFDATSRASYKNLPTYQRDLARICGDIPIVLCANKADDQNRRIRPEQINFHNRHNLPYFEISVSSNLNLDAPLLCLARQLSLEPDLEFVAQPPQVIAGGANIGQPNINPPVAGAVPVMAAGGGSDHSEGIAIDAGVGSTENG
jgi:GTP-binding nuclear protein Ran